MLCRISLARRRRKRHKRVKRIQGNGTDTGAEIFDGLIMGEENADEGRVDNAVSFGNSRCRNRMRRTIQCQKEKTLEHSRCFFCSQF